jgi:CTP synthase (UTP-ammonia lyase)
VIRVILVGDESKEVLAHQAIPKALALAAEKLSVDVAPEWLPTEQITSANTVAKKNPNAIWCVPGSPYRNMDGALTAIHFARENKIPFLGTCGGFQHAVIEIARNVLNMRDADHTESNPSAKTPLISKLACSLINQSERIRIKPNTALRRIYGADEITEAYQCSFGLNPELKHLLRDANLEFSAHNAGDDAVRAIELRNHPFFIATLFQPERSAASGVAHPLIAAFLKAAHDRAAPTP